MGKILLIAVGALALIAVGRIVIPTHPPEISLAAEKLGEVGPVAITNTMVATWVAILVLTVVSILAIRKRSLVPSGWQAWIESYLEAMMNLVEGVAGKTWGRRFFPLVSTIFLFVITNNWLSLLPGYGTITWNVEEEGHTVALPLLRGASTDLNTTFALALIAMAMVQVWGIRSGGIGAYLGKYFTIRGSNIMMKVVNCFIGILELISEVARTLALGFRLFGNMFAGEVLILVITFLIPLVIADIFYGLEVLVGFIQALIFAMLTLVFASMAVAGHGGGEHKSEGHAT